MGVRLVYFNKPLNHTDNNKKLLEDHNDLINRDIQDQHPIYAISGLNEVLSTVETLLTQQTAEHEYLTGKLHESENRVEILNTLLSAIKEKVDQFTDWKEDTLASFQEVIDVINAPQILDVIDNNAIDLEYDASNKKLEAKLKVVTNSTLYSIRNRSHTVNRLYVTKNGLYVPNDTLLNSKSITWENEQSTDTHAMVFERGYYFSHKSTSREDVYDETRADYWSYNETDNTLTFNYQGESSEDIYQGFITNTLYTDFTVELTFRNVGYKHTGGTTNPCRVCICLYTYDSNNNFITYDYTLSPEKHGWPGSGNGYLRLMKDFMTTSATELISYFSGATYYVNSSQLETLKLVVSNCKLQYVERYVGNSANYAQKSYANNANNLNGTPLHVGFGICGIKNITITKFKITVPEGKTVQEQQGIITVDNFRPHVRINPSSTNAIRITNEGLFSPGISTETDNAIIEKSDGGFFVQDTKLSDKFGNDIVWDGNKVLYCRAGKDYKEVTQEAHEFSIGNFIYYSETYNKYLKAIAIDDYDANVIGMVTRIIDSNTFEYMWSGYFATDIFNSANGYHQGMPLYLSDTQPGSVTQTQPDISKTVGYPVENTGIIISLERGIQYNNEPKLGEFKQSTLTYNVRTDGYIRVVENIQYKLSLVGSVINAVSESFKNNYMIINELNQTLMFKNVDDLKFIMNIPEGIELFIKAF